MRVLFQKGLTVLLAAVFVATQAAPVHAQANGQVANGMRVSPLKTPNIEIERGSSTVTPVYVQNLTTETVTLRAIVNDFVADGEEGRPGIMLEEDSYAPNHSLKRFIAPIQNVTVKPNERVEVPVNITVPMTAQAGGYYAAVRFAPAAENGGDANVDVAVSVASLIFVKVPGEMKEEMLVETFEVRQNDEPKTWLRTTENVNMVMRFKNNGDVQIEPFGKLIVKKGSNVIKEYEINDTNPRGYVLPDRIRRFEIPLEDIDGFGKYTIEAHIGYGTSGQLISQTYEFYMIPQNAIIATGIGLITAIGLGLLIPRGIKRYNQMIIRKSGRRYRY